MNDSQVRPPPPYRDPWTRIRAVTTAVVVMWVIHGCYFGALQKRVERLEQRETSRQVISVEFNSTNLWTRP